MYAQLEQIFDLLPEETKPEVPAYLRDFQDTLVGKLPAGYTLAQHYLIAQDVIAKHNAGYADFLFKVWSSATKNAEITGRVKHVYSALSKLIVKPHYGDTRKLQDVTGIRIVCADIPEVHENVRRLKKAYKVVNEDNYIKHPKNSYRAYHIVVRDKDKLEKEVQILTRNELKFALWQHNLYKPLTSLQKRVVAKDATAAKSYAAAMSRYFYDIDRGKDATKPICPNEVHAVFGSL